MSRNTARMGPSRDRSRKSRLWRDSPMFPPQTRSRQTPADRSCPGPIPGTSPSKSEAEISRCSSPCMRVPQRRYGRGNRWLPTDYIASFPFPCPETLPNSADPGALGWQVRTDLAAWGSQPMLQPLTAVLRNATVHPSSCLVETGRREFSKDRKTGIGVAS